jgi:phospholipase C
MPQQEKGIKPSCALPYQLYADGKLSADKKSFDIQFAAADKAFGQKALGSPFNVYAPGKYASFNDPQQMEPLRTWSYALTAGDSLTDTWPLHEFENSEYHLRVYGPNGFYREYKGNNADPLIDVICEYEQGAASKLTGNIALKLVNSSSKSYTIEITDHSYKTNNFKKTITAKGQSTQVLNLAKSHGWYDFSIKVTGIQSFEKRYAGRVETGQHSFSDPLMGKVV